MLQRDLIDRIRAKKYRLQTINSQSQVRQVPRHPRNAERHWVRQPTSHANAFSVQE